MQRATYPVYVRLQLQHRLMASRSSWPCDKVDSCSNRRTLAVPCSLAGAPWLQFASWSRRRRALQAAKPDVEAETEAVQVALCAMSACVVRCYHWRETIIPLNWFCNLFARIMRTCTEEKREGDRRREQEGDLGAHTCPEPKTSDCHRQLQKKERKRRVSENESEEAGKFVRGRIFNSIYSQ